MALTTPKIMWGKVMHARLFPRRNNFTYGIYYLALPLSRLSQMNMAYNRFAALSFYDRDHGARDGSGLEIWARAILKDYGLGVADGEITLICMPRIFGYVFNPVSFWMCHDKAGFLRAVLCEVNNTFGERHTYICAQPDHAKITPNDTIRGQKLFHVSPFLEREGSYEFRFEMNEISFKAFIDYFDAADKKKLLTSLGGTFHALNKTRLRQTFWAYPLVTIKAIMLIHWQALKLITKGVRYIKKPLQNIENVSPSHNLTKM